MAIRPTASVDRPFLLTTAANPVSSSEIEREVIGLFDQFRSSVLRYTLAFGLSVHDGEELTQEVFLALFRHIAEGKSRQNLRGWIFCVAHNLALKQLHINQRRQLDRALDGMTAENPIDPSPDPEEQALATQRQGRLLAVVRALSEQDQCCLRLRAEGLRYREIARVLGVSLGAVSQSLARSIARLTRAQEV